MKVASNDKKVAVIKLEGNNPKIRSHRSSWSFHQARLACSHDVSANFARRDGGKTKRRTELVLNVLGKTEGDQFLEFLPTWSPKGGLRRVFKRLAAPPNIASAPHRSPTRINLKHQTSQNSLGAYHPRTVKAISLRLAEINPKMFSSFPKVLPWTINANKDAAPSRYLSSICSSGRRTACHNLALASLRQTKPSHTHNMEHILQRRHHQSLHRRLRLSTR